MSKDFMQPQVTTRRTWYEMETAAGTWFIDTADVDGGEIAEELRATDYDDMTEERQDEIADTLADYHEGDLQDVHIRVGYGARLSAPGYLDCTDWTVFDTPEEAEAYLKETYELDDEEEQ